MKIGILTFHYAHNYGAMLQAYALTSLLHNWGHDVEIINYRLPVVDFVYQKRSFLQLINFFQERDSLIISFLKAIKYYPKERKKISSKWHKFEDFSQKYLPKTKRINDINCDSLNLFDAIICGSDQIWSTYITKRFIPLYFCYGFNRKIKRISYAASAGRGKIDEKDEAEFLDLCSNFNYISVREKSLSAYMKSLGIDNKVVLDPIFLIKKEHWSKLAILPQEQDYVLAYSFSEPLFFYEKALEIAHKMGKQLISFSFRKKKLPSEIIQEYNGGPQEFLGYFLNASVVITNSFHGTAFSVLFNKQFYNILPMTGADRVLSLLTQLVLENRIIEELTNTETVGNINYEAVESRLNELVQDSYSFLKSALK